MYSGVCYSEIALEARNLCVRQQQPSWAERKMRVNTLLQEVAYTPVPDPKRRAIIESLADHADPILDAMLNYMSKEQASTLLMGDDCDVFSLRAAAMESYLFKIHRSHNLDSLECFQVNTSDSDNLVVARWVFHYKPIPGVVPISDLEPMAPISDYKSLDELSKMASEMYTQAVVKPTSPVKRQGLMVFFNGLGEMRTHFSTILQLFNPVDNDKSINTTVDQIQEPHLSNVLHVAMCVAREVLHNEQAMVETLQSLIASRASQLEEFKVRRVTFVLTPDPSPSLGSTKKLINRMTDNPRVYTFRHRLQYAEDPIVRHIEPPFAHLLELRRLRYFYIHLVPTANRSVHLYCAEPKAECVNEILEKEGFPSRAQLHKGMRLFVRTLVRSSETMHRESDCDLDQPYSNHHPVQERAFVESLNALELAMGEQKYSSSRCNHIFLKYLTSIVASPEYFIQVIKIFAYRYAERIQKLNISQVELSVNAQFNPDSEPVPLRLVASNPTGYSLIVDCYVEVVQPEDPEKAIFQSVGAKSHDYYTMGEWEGQETSIPYPVAELFAPQRSAAAASSGTLYVYDFPVVLERALRNLWKDHYNKRVGAGDIDDISTAVPTRLIEIRELVLWYILFIYFVFFSLFISLFLRKSEISL